MTNAKELAVKSVMDLWNGRIKQVDALLENLSDEQLQKEVTPGRNRGTYLVGHLAAVNDALLPLLNFGEALYPNLAEPFLSKPDKAVAEVPSAKELRANWKTINDKLAGHFSKMTADDWFLKHNSVSTEDFAKEPHRNRLTVVMGRAAHMSYHIGQLVFLKK